MSQQTINLIAIFAAPLVMILCLIFGKDIDRPNCECECKCKSSRDNAH